MDRCNQGICGPVTNAVMGQAIALMDKYIPEFIDLEDTEYNKLYDKLRKAIEDGINSAMNAARRTKEDLADESRIAHETRIKRQQMGTLPGSISMSDWNGSSFHI